MSTCHRQYRKTELLFSDDKYIPFPGKINLATFVHACCVFVSDDKNLLFLPVHLSISWLVTLACEVCF